MMRAKVDIFVLDVKNILLDCVNVYNWISELCFEISDLLNADM